MLIVDQCCCGQHGLPAACAAHRHYGGLRWRCGSVRGNQQEGLKALVGGGEESRKLHPAAASYPLLPAAAGRLAGCRRRPAAHMPPVGGKQAAPIATRRTQGGIGCCPGPRAGSNRSNQQHSRVGRSTLIRAPHTMLGEVWKTHNSVVRPNEGQIQRAAECTLACTAGWLASHVGCRTAPLPVLLLHHPL